MHAQTPPKSRGQVAMDVSSPAGKSKPLPKQRSCKAASGDGAARPESPGSASPAPGSTSIVGSGAEPGHSRGNSGGSSSSLSPSPVARIKGLVSPQISASAASMDLERLTQVEARPGGLLAALRERGTLPSFGGTTPVASPPRLDPSPAPITRAEEVPPEALKSRPTPQRTQKPTAAKSKPKLGTSKDGFEPSASEARPGLRKAKRPPVPAFALKPPEPEPWQLLRQIQLPDKKEEENYEISEKGSNSEAEEEPDRSHKRTPDWSLKFLELLETQVDIDADTIFGSRVPRCVLEEIFTDRDYLRYAADRPARRRRGSSGEWRRDRLSRAEICKYKEQTGQHRRWQPRG